MDPGLALGGIGCGLVVSDDTGLLVTAPFSLYLGGDLGFWGGSLTVLSPARTAFAWSETRALVLSLRAWGRATLEAGGFRLFAEFGPEFGTNIAYRADESVNGVDSTSLLRARAADFGFLGAGVGLGFDFPLGATRWGLEATGEYGLVPIASDSGALGAAIGSPWRVELRVVGRFDLGKSGEKRKGKGGI